MEKTNVDLHNKRGKFVFSYYVKISSEEKNLPFMLCTNVFFASLHFDISIV